MSISHYTRALATATIGGEFHAKGNARHGDGSSGAVYYVVRNYGDYPRLLDRILIADEPLYAGL